MAAKSGEKAKYCHLLPAGCQGDGKKNPLNISVSGQLPLLPLFLIKFK